MGKRLKGSISLCLGLDKAALWASSFLAPNTYLCILLLPIPQLLPFDIPIALHSGRETPSRSCLRLHSDLRDSGPCLPRI